MKRAFISDIHGNLKALESALKEIKADEIYCLGDIVDRFPHSNACIRLIRENCKASVLGNHDIFSAKYGYCDLEEPTRKPDTSKNEHLDPEFYKELLTDDNKEYLASRPIELELGDLFLSHTLHDIRFEPWFYIMEVPDAFFGFGLLKKKIAVIGHSHIPKIFEEEKVNETEYEIIKHEVKSGKLSIEIREDRRYILDVGSIGIAYERENHHIGYYGIIDGNKIEIHSFNI